MQLKIAFCGDIMLGAEVGERIGSTTIAEWVDDVAGAWTEADLVIGNLECPCVVDANPVESRAPELVFHAPAHRLHELALAGFSALTIANNHILNCGSQGLLETIQGLDRAGIYHAGAGMNLSEAVRPAFITLEGATVGLLAFCYGPPAGESSAGVAPHDYRTMRNALCTARAEADVVIAALHDGLEYSDVPPSETRTRFRFLAENGADIVIGHHPHVLQGLEWIGKVPVAYSLGNFLFHSSLPHVTERSLRRIAMALYAPEEIVRDPDKFSRGAVLTVHVSDNGKTVNWHPFRQSPDLCPQLCRGYDKVEDLRRLDELSAALFNECDYRHSLADQVLRSASTQTLGYLGLRDVIKLATRPKWRYLPRGLNWLVQRIKFAKS